MMRTPGGERRATQYSSGNRFRPSRMPVVISTSAAMHNGMRSFRDTVSWMWKYSTGSHPGRACLSLISLTRDSISLSLWPQSADRDFSRMPTCTSTTLSRHTGYLVRNRSNALNLSEMPFSRSVLSMPAMMRRPAKRALSASASRVTLGSMARSVIKSGSMPTWETVTMTSLCTHRHTQPQPRTHTTRACAPIHEFTRAHSSEKWGNRTCPAPPPWCGRRGGWSA